MICKRLFYSVFYILFIYRSNFVISNSTSAVPVESGSASVDPNATAVDPNGGAPLAGGVAMATTPDAGTSWVAAGSPEPNAALTGAQPVAAPVAQGIPMTAVNQAAHVVNQGAPAVNPGAPAAPMAGLPPAGAPVVHQAAPVVNQAAPAVNLGAPAATMAGLPPAGAPVAHSVPMTHVPEANAAMAAPAAGQETSHLAGASAVNEPAHVATHVEPAQAMPATHLGAQPGTHASPLSGATLLKATPPAGAPVASHVTAGAPAMPAHMPAGSQYVASPGAGAPVAGAPVAGAPVAGVPVAGAHVPGAHLAGTHVAHATPVLTPLDPNASMNAAATVEPHVQPMTAPVTGSSAHMAAPMAGASLPMENAHTAGAPAMGTPMTFDAHGTTAAHVASHVSSGAQFAPAPPTAGAQDMASTIAHGTHTLSSPVNFDNQIVTTTSIMGAPSVTINLANPDPALSTSNLQKIMIDIFLNKADSDYIKYRRDDANGTDIFYAKDGYIISEIQMNGKKRWPDDDKKVCKKVLYIINPSDGKKTLRVIYADESDAYDPDNPPVTPDSTSVSAPSTDPTAAYTASSDFSQYQPVSVPAGSAMTPGIESVLAATDPSELASAPQDQKYKVDSDGQVYLEFTVSKGQDSEEHGPSASGPSAFTVEEIRAPRAGRTIEYQDSDDEFIPGEDDDTPVDLSTYVTTVGRRVRALESRMDSTEDTLKLLVRTLDYQHELLEFRRKFGVKTAPFGADFGRQSFYDPEAFKPATSLVSKVLDASEHPSDIKLFVLDTAAKLVALGNDKFKVKQEGEEIHYDLEKDVECKLVTFKDRTVWHHRENDPHPLGVVFHPDDDKVVVDFDDAIVMYVKKGELAGVANAGAPVKKSILDIPLGKFDSEEEEAKKSNEPDASVHNAAAEVKEDANETALEGVVKSEASLSSNEQAGHSTVASEAPAESAPVVPAHTASVSAEHAHTESVPAENAHTASSVAAPAAHAEAVPANALVAQAAPVTPVPNGVAAPVSPVANGAAAPLSVATSVAQAAPLTASLPAEASATPVAQTAAVPAANSEALSADASASTVVLTESTPATNPEASAPPAQEASEGAPTV